MPKKIKIKDIAKEVGCSPATVSQAFHNPKLVNRKTRMEILETCERLGYVRKKMSSKKRKVIGITGISHELILGEYYNRVTAAILTTAKVQGINVVIEFFGEDEDTLPHMFAKKLLDGVIVLGRVSQDHVLMIKQQDIPLVLCGNPAPGIELHTVLSDGRSGIYQVAKHLIELGHRKIGYITGSQVFDPVTSDRLDGFKFAVNEAGIALPEEYIAIGDFHTWQTAANGVEKLMGLNKPPTAIVCESDALAYIAYQKLNELGYKIPKDVSLTGFDDLPFPPYIEAVKPQLTTVQVNLAELGQTAVNVLLDLIDNPSRVAYRHTLPVKLAVKKTTGALKK
ncbi:MAG: LacI family DNA-binding transcriptional regulator [Candidatus Margulisiibacteriota bacterium]